MGPHTAQPHVPIGTNHDMGTKEDIMAPNPHSRRIRALARTGYPPAVGIILRQARRTPTRHPIYLGSRPIRHHTHTRRSIRARRHGMGMATRTIRIADDHDLPEKGNMARIRPNIGHRKTPTSHQRCMRRRHRKRQIHKRWANLRRRIR